ncbi:MAG: EMC3/TMCO1 family protein, partial [Candidatus Aenigmarchaeota archaeon]|nr:EMC3/TMCO1 family protein [Candidatus Aenigmarchaeota archaeon]
MNLESVFGFLLNYNPTIAIIIYAFLVLLLINIFYKILIKQQDAKQLKEKMNEINKQMKEEQKAGNKEKANQLVGEMMHANSTLMKMTMKPMIVSFIIVIILLP